MAEHPYRTFVLSSGAERTFPSFGRAERWARRFVADSADGEYPDSVQISCSGEWIAVVRMDGADRVWTDMR